MTERLINCVKLNKELPGLEKPPFSGPIGQEIYEKISKTAWEMWTKDMQIKVINEYRLNMGDKDDYNMLVEQMLLFLNLKEGSTVEVDNAERGKSE